MAGNEKFSRKLLVEGKDDEHVIYALRALHNIFVNFDIIDCKGITNLFDAMSVRLKQSDIETIGIIIDADIDLNGRWQRVSAILSDVGFRIPENIPDHGLVVSHPVSNIRVGVWIMPDNNINGMLEDFMRFLIPADDNLLPMAENALNEIEKNNFNKYQLVHRPKALIHTWLAWQADAGKPLGQSITMKYLHTDNETCLKLVNWLKNTFAE